MHKDVKSEIAISIIVLVALLVGGCVLLQRKKAQSDLDTAVCKQESGIVFLGDSITALENWNALFGISCIVNAGISGNTTDDVLTRLDSVIISKPRKLFLMIGINDLLRNKDVAYVLSNYEIILNKIKAQSPVTIVYVQSALPINNDILKNKNTDSQEIIEFNSKLKNIAADRNLTYIDLYPSFCSSDNKLYRIYSKDGLHPGFLGYSTWKDLIDKYLE